MVKQFMMKVGIIRIFIGSSSCAALFVAFFYEYYLGYMPCDICLYQRIPYFLLVFISIFARSEKIFRILSIIILLCSTLLSIYHMQVENGLIADSCAKKITHSLSSEEIVKQINSVERPSCSVINVKISGISMSALNGLFSIFLITTILLYNRKKLL